MNSSLKRWSFNEVLNELMEIIVVISMCELTDAIIYVFRIDQSPSNINKLIPRASMNR